MTYVENAKEYKNKYKQAKETRITHKFSKFEAHKINTQKAITFLYTNNEDMEKNF